MSDAYKINVSLLKTYESNFNTERNNFNNKTYETFLSSYLKTCSDPYVHSMSTELQRIYEQIKKGYNNIDKWWVDYNNNAETLENYLSGTGYIGSITETSIRNNLNNMPELEDYSVRYTKAYYSTLINQQVLNNPQLMAIQNAVSGAQTIGQDIDAIIPANQPTIVSTPPKQEEQKEEKGGLFKWFKDTGAKISKSVSTAWNKTKKWVSDTAESVGEWMSDTAAIVTDTVYNAWNNTTEWFSDKANDIRNWWKSDALPWIENASNEVWRTVKSVGATVATFAQSLVEGVCQFGEAIVDFVGLAGTAVFSIFTGIYDGIQAIDGAITGNEWESVTKKMWNGTMGFVSNKYVTGWFDSLYQNTAYGQWLSENAYWFDSTRAVGSGLGYIAGVVVLSIATFGAGSVVAGGGTLTATTAAAATSATNMAITATAAGIGKGTQDAWADGADLLEGLTAGTLNGLWEGLQFFIGGKISGLKIFGADGIVKSVGTSAMGIKLLNSLSRVVLDGVDGGIEGFIQPLITSIYKDGYYDESGNYIEFSDTQNIFERYSELFNDNGGWSFVWTQAIVGSTTSMIGELFDLRKYFKEEHKTKIFESDVTNNLDSSTKPIIDIAEKNAALTDFKNIMTTDNLSNQSVVDLVYKTFDDSINNGNTEALNVLKMFNELKKKNPDLKIVINSDTIVCYWDKNISAIVINPATLAMSDSGTITHELGHCLFDSILDGQLPNNWDSISEKARITSTNNPLVSLQAVTDELKKISASTYDSATIEFKNMIKDQYGVTIDEYEKLLANKYSRWLELSGKDLDLQLKQVGYDSETITKIFAGIIDEKDLATIEIRNNIASIAEKINRTQYADHCAISDIIDAVYIGTQTDLRGQGFILPYGHGSQYYLERSANAPFHEIIANFTQLKITGKQSSLDSIKIIFGEEFYNMLEEVFLKFNYK